MRYQVVYSKTHPQSQPGVVYTATLEEAKAKAAQLRCTGYAVDIWEQDEKYATLLKEESDSD